MWTTTATAFTISLLWFLTHSVVVLAADSSGSSRFTLVMGGAAVKDNQT